MLLPMLKLLVLSLLAFPLLARAFDGALSSSNLQYEIGDEDVWDVTGSDTLLTYPEMAYFYFIGPYLVFDLYRDGHRKKRAELRQYPEWQVSDSNSVHATMRLEASKLDEFTWMQLQRKEDWQVKPPLRLTWEKQQEIDGKTYRDYLVAVFYHGDEGYHKVPLIPRPDGDFDVDLYAHNHQVYIVLNDSLVHVENVVGWSDYQCYFKVGLYTSGNKADYGGARVGVRELRYQLEGSP